jgi:hypothetical protein
MDGWSGHRGGALHYYENGADLHVRASSIDALQK